MKFKPKVALTMNEAVNVKWWISTELSLICAGFVMCLRRCRPLFFLSIFLFAATQKCVIAATATKSTTFSQTPIFSTAFVWSGFLVWYAVCRMQVATKQYVIDNGFTY